MEFFWPIISLHFFSLQLIWKKYIWIVKTLTWQATGWLSMVTCFFHQFTFSIYVTMCWLMCYYSFVFLIFFCFCLFFSTKSQVKVTFAAVCSSVLFKGCKKTVVFPRLSVVMLVLGLWWVDWQAERQSVGQPCHLSLLFTMLCDWQRYRHSPNLQPKHALTTAFCTDSCNTNCYGSMLIFFLYIKPYNQIQSL